jgi:hypothetical protein
MTTGFCTKLSQYDLSSGRISDYVGTVVAFNSKKFESSDDCKNSTVHSLPSVEVEEMLI